MHEALKLLISMVKPKRNDLHEAMKQQAIEYCCSMAGLPLSTKVEVIHFKHGPYASTVVVEFPNYTQASFLTISRLESVRKRFIRRYAMRFRGERFRYYGRIDKQRYVIVHVPERCGMRIALFNFNEVENESVSAS